MWCNPTVSALRAPVIEGYEEDFEAYSIKVVIFIVNYASVVEIKFVTLAKIGIDKTGEALKRFYILNIYSFTGYRIYCSFNGVLNVLSSRFKSHNYITV